MPEGQRGLTSRSIAPVTNTVEPQVQEDPGQDIKQEQQRVVHVIDQAEIQDAEGA